MNPSYRYQIDITILGVRDVEDVTVRKIGYLGFVPRNGDVLRFTNEETDETLDIELEGGVYDSAAGCHVFALTNDDIRTSYRDNTPIHMGDVIAMYKPYDFQRLRTPA